jgi:hypothetical protein
MIFCAKLFRYVGTQTSTCLPPPGPDASADASAGAPSPGVVASASLPPEPDPLEPLVELLLEPPDDPLLEPLEPPLEPAPDPPPEEELPPPGGGTCPSPVLAQPAVNAKTTQVDRARVDRSRGRILRAGAERVPLATRFHAAGHEPSRRRLTRRPRMTGFLSCAQVWGFAGTRRRTRVRCLRKSVGDVASPRPLRSRTSTGTRRTR